MDAMTTIQPCAVVRLLARQGKKLHAFAGDSITAKIESRGEYDTNTLDSLRAILSFIHPDTSLDVGANIGNHAVGIAELSQHLIAFEPVPFIFELLQRNLSQNGFSHAIPVNAGLSDQMLERDIFIPEYGNLGCSSLESMDAEGVHRRIDFIKIDIEGHEPAALLGLQTTICEHQPLILMESLTQNTLNLFNDRKLFEQLFSGYRIYALSNTTSKNVYPPGMTGFVRRMAAKLRYRCWCQSDFDAARRYSNIYLVPERYQAIFEQFTYLSAQ
jgi:hypothetical protein